MTDHLYLAHHGIKGMKWGVRRFRNKDGSLTKAGKERYWDDSSGRRKHIPHREKLVAKYRSKGMSQKEAEAAADKRISTEKKIAIGAGIAMATVAAYATYKYVSSDKLDSNVNLDSQLMRKTFESTDFDTAINDDLRRINREGWAGHLLLRGREVNCTSCSMAYEMRRRGYDVVAGRRAFRGRTNEEMEQFFQGAKFQELASDWVDSKTPPPPPDSPNFSEWWDNRYLHPVDKWTYAEQELLRQGEGARGIINGWYKQGGGHSIAYEIHDGKVHFVDGQIGRQYKDAFDALGQMGSYNFLRTDTLALTNNAAETVLNNTKRSLLTELPSNLAIEGAAVGTYTAAKVVGKNKPMHSRSARKKRRRIGG